MEHGTWNMEQGVRVAVLMRTNSLWFNTRHRSVLALFQHVVVYLRVKTPQMSYKHRTS